MAGYTILIRPMQFELQERLWVAEVSQDYIIKSLN